MKPFLFQKIIRLNENKLYFDFDDSRIKPEYYGVLREMVTEIKEMDSDVVIRGYTDSKGTAEYNQKLSERRAAAVADVYTQVIGTGSGIRYNVAGYGEDRPVAANTLSNGKDSPEGRAKNRRVEVKFYPDNKIIKENNVNYEIDVESQIK